MSIFGITGVHLDDAGRMLRAAICGIDPASLQFVGIPTVMEAHEVASLLDSGDSIYAVFGLGDDLTLGPKFRYATYAGGEEGAELETDEPGQRLTDLVLIA